MNPQACIPGSKIEILDSPTTGGIRHAVFDFDGTLSMVRDGWQDIMVPMMVEILEACPQAESRQELEALVMDFVDHLTGKQTIFQMMRLKEEVEKRGGESLEPLAYKQIYNDRILPVAENRLSGLKSGSIDPESLRVTGAYTLLKSFQDKGVKLYLASGTDVEFVKDEAQALGLAEFFDGGIFGALPNLKDFSKEMVIKKIVADFDLSGPELVVLGDGYVEILKGRQIDAITVGLVSPEGNQYHMNSNKRDRLIKAGSHLLVEPDWGEWEILMDYLF